jgi:hypothetical protein
MGAHPDADETVPGGRIPSQMAPVKLKMLNAWFGILGIHAHACGERPNSSLYPFLIVSVNISRENNTVLIVNESIPRICICLLVFIKKKSLFCRLNYILMYR